MSQTRKESPPPIPRAKIFQSYPSTKVIHKRKRRKVPEQNVSGVIAFVGMQTKLSMTWDHTAAVYKYCADGSSSSLITWHIRPSCSSSGRFAVRLPI
jgi:hypothetical protein